MTRKIAMVAAALIAFAAPAAADAQVRLRLDGAFDLAQGRGRGPDGNGPPGQMRGQMRGQVIGTQRAVAIARARAGGGEVMDAGLAGANYRVRIRTPNGRIIDFIIDAETGAILAMDGG